MKTLKPNTNTSSTIVPQDYFSSIREELRLAMATIEALSVRISTLETELSSNTINKESGYFENVQTTNNTTTHSLNASSASITNLDTVAVEADSITTDTINSNLYEGNRVDVNKVEADEGKITDLTTTNSSLTNATIGTATVNSLEANEGHVTDLEVDSFSAQEFTIPSLNALTSVTSSTVNTSNLDAAEASIDSLEADEGNITGLTVDQLSNSKKLFDTSKFILTDTQNNDPYYIKIPHFTSGSYRVELKDANEARLFSVVVINSIDAPLITYTKLTDDALTKINYDTELKDIYLESYTPGKLYWSADTNDQNSSPSTYTEMPVTTDTEYLTSAMKRVVVLGNETAYYGMDVLGSLKASIFVDTTTEGTPLFYSGNASGLISHLNTYLSSENDEPHSVSVAGYMKDNDTGIEYSIQTITRDSENKLWVLVETLDGAGTDKIQLTPELDVAFGLFTDTYQWDQNING